MMDSAAPNEIDVDQIVGEVMARLDASRPPRTERSTVQAATRRVLENRLITVKLLEAELDGAKELAVKPRAVITPAARDWLAEKKVGLVRWTEKQRDAADEPSGQLAVGIADCSGSAVTVKQLQHALQQQVTVLGGRDVVALVYAIRRHALQQGRALIVTARSALALCVANRISAVRAVSADNVQRLQVAVAEVGANVVIIDPTGLSIWQQLQMARWFAATDNVPCAKELA